MTINIYMDRPGDYVNQRLVNLIINEQLPIWDKNNFCKYEKIYLISIIQVFLKFKFDTSVSQ